MLGKILAIDEKTIELELQVNISEIKNTLPYGIPLWQDSGGEGIAVYCLISSFSDTLGATLLNTSATSEMVR